MERRHDPENIMNDIDGTLSETEPVLDEHKRALGHLTLFEECFCDLPSDDFDVIEETVYERLGEEVDDETRSRYMRRWFNHGKS